MKKLVFLVISSTLILAVAGCAPRVEPMAEEIFNKKFEQLQLASEEIIPNCGASFGFPCQEPLYSLFFIGQASVAPEDVCKPVIEFQRELGLDAYSAEGASEVGSADDLTEVINFCIEGLQRDLGDGTGLSYYEGTVLFEDGSEDGLGKTTVISRREDGSYFVDFSIGRDKGRIGYFELNGQPVHQTLE
ncbi:MAG: hypothetical protein RIR89_1308 [Actinomycetota bacterium]|jgi:hypothetical protein